VLNTDRGIVSLVFAPDLLIIDADWQSSTRKSDGSCISEHNSHHSCGEVDKRGLFRL